MTSLSADVAREVEILCQKSELAIGGYANLKLSETLGLAGFSRSFQSIGVQGKDRARKTN
jgi:hypothetical protein